MCLVVLVLLVLQKQIQGEKQSAHGLPMFQIIFVHDLAFDPLSVVINGHLLSLPSFSL